MIDKPMKLGELIAKCEEIAAKDYKCHDGSLPWVQFDFENATPDSIGSWRGVYAQLAISFEFIGTITLPDFITMLKNANGATFSGYKGGEFLMHEDTELWVANYGRAGNTAVAGVIDKKYYVVIETAFCDPD